jgi:hypothetical protein
MMSKVDGAGQNDLERQGRVAMITTGRVIIANTLKISELPLAYSIARRQTRALASSGRRQAPTMGEAPRAINALMSESRKIYVNE